MKIFQYLKTLKSWHPNIYEIYAEDIAEKIAEGKEGLYFIKHHTNNLYVYRGNTEIDLNHCKLNNMTVYELEYGGGPLIGSNIDLSFGFIYPGENPDASMIALFALADIFKKYGLNAIVSGNDILIDGKKVVGSFIKVDKDKTIWCAQISFRDYSNHIKALCTKPKLKKPGYIKEHQLSRMQLKQDIIKIFK